MGNATSTSNNDKTTNSYDYKHTDKMVTIPEYESKPGCKLFKYIWNGEWSNALKSEFCSLAPIHSKI